MYKSQIGQDKYLDEQVFHKSRNGIFVDVGAHDGVSLSNTYFFEKERDWTGICIEANPDLFEQLKHNRECVTLCNAAYDKRSTLQFMKTSGYTEMLSGVVDDYNPKHLSRIQSEINHYGGDTQVINVESVRLGDVFKEHQIEIVDYLSIDVEGSELKVLQGIDFDRVHINVVDFEENYTEDTEEIHNLLQSKGFRLLKKHYFDVFYINKDLQLSFLTLIN